MQLKEGPIGAPIEGHPDLTELFRVLLEAQPLLVAQGGGKELPAYVIVGDPDSKSQFTFTKTADGYTLVRTK